jgi:RNA polymerase sigma factor (sigma-70 family)
MLGMSPALLGELLDRHGAALVLFARQFCTSPEDVVQESFVQLARQGTAPDQPVAWLYRVVRNGAISAARGDQRRRKHETAAAARATNWFWPAKATRFDAESASEALARLPLDEREIIVSHVWGGLTFQQIGELVGLSAATAYRRYEAGLRSLRTMLGQETFARPEGQSRSEERKSTRTET